MIINKLYGSQQTGQVNSRLCLHTPSSAIAYLPTVTLPFIAPLSIRQQMTAEATQELANYQAE